jgi:hypothetical protein
MTSLDTVGLAGFGHDFGTILGRPSAVGSSFEAVSSAQFGVLDAVILLLQPVLPFLTRIPTNRHKAVNKMALACSDIAKKLIARTTMEEKDERSIMGLLSK